MQLTTGQHLRRKHRTRSHDGGAKNTNTHSRVRVLLVELALCRTLIKNSLEITRARYVRRYVCTESTMLILLGKISARAQINQESSTSIDSAATSQLFPEEEHAAIDEPRLS